MSKDVILSPMQPNYVNKEEFGRFSQKVDKRFDEQKSYMDTGFTKLGEQIDAVETNMNTKFGLLSADVSWLKRSVGKMMKKMGV